MYAPTQEEINDLVHYLNDENPDVLFTEAPKKYLLMAYDLQKKLFRDLAKLSKRNAELEKRLSQQLDKKEESFLQGNFREHEAGFQDTDIAKIAIHYLKQKKCRYDMEKVIHITYLVYAVFLTKGLRLFPQQPQATSHGPWFWRVTNHLEKKSSSGKMILYEEPEHVYLAELYEKETAVFAIVRNIVEKYYDTDLKKMLLNSKPYLNNTKEFNDGKWNKEIPDGEIYAWQKSRV